MPRAKRGKIEVPHFGRLLENARGGRDLGTVVAKMHGLSPELHGFTRPQLVRYEKGQTSRPDPVHLFFLAQLYKADIVEWLTALAHEREQIAAAADAAAESPPRESHTARRRRASSA